MLDDGTFNEFWAEEAMPGGLLIKQIVELEEVTGEHAPDARGGPTGEEPVPAPGAEFELDSDLQACNAPSRCGLPRFATCQQERPIVCSKPLYYDRVIPYPVYKKQIVPVEVVQKVPVYIKKCVPVHVPVRVPVKVPVRVEVPCYQEYTKVIPVHRTVRQEVPQYIHRTKIVTEHVPKVTVVRVPVVHHRRVTVAQPYNVIDRIKVVTSVVPRPAPCACNQCSSCNQY
jgi:hypothetical protein